LVDFKQLLYTFSRKKSSTKNNKLQKKIEKEFEIISDKQLKKDIEKKKQ